MNRPDGAEFITLSNTSCNLADCHNEALTGASQIRRCPGEVGLTDSEAEDQGGKCCWETRVNSFSRGPSYYPMSLDQMPDADGLLSSAFEAGRLLSGLPVGGGLLQMRRLLRLAN